MTVEYLLVARKKIIDLLEKRLGHLREVVSVKRKRREVV